MKLELVCSGALRFGEVPTEIRSRVAALDDESTLEALVDSAALCPDLAAFHARLPN